MTQAAELRWLALGDSYTIAESVPLANSYPHQTVRRLAQQGLKLAVPTIIARTGWTTDELMAAVQQAQPDDQYAIATLLIGVNNQYRGWPLDQGQLEFEGLVGRALQAVGGRKERVAVLSIPDWGRTPFGRGHPKGRDKIGQEIDAWNQAQREWCAQNGIRYFEITQSTRQNVGKPGHVASDGLHPGAAEYALWAEQLAAWIDPLVRAELDHDPETIAP